MHLGDTHGDTHGGFIIRGGSIATLDGLHQADIRVCGEQIAEIGERLPRQNGDGDEIDARGLLVLPGGVDPHVHLTTPPATPSSDRWVDDLSSGSRAALAGGVTTLGNMSLPLPGETLLDTLRRERCLVEQQAIADVMIHPVLLPPVETAQKAFSALAAAGCATVKVFMCIPAFDEHAGDYFAALRAAGEAGLLTLIHAEDHAIIQDATRALLSEGRGALRYYAESRPVVAETAATRRALAMCEASGAPVYVLHLSSEQALQICQAARAKGLPVYVETRPLYLHFTRACYLDPQGPLFVGQPPLRDERDVGALWEGLGAGDIDVIATDHAPWTREQKMDRTLNVAKLRPGVNNLQFMLPLLYSEGVRKGRLSLERFVAVTSTNAARLFGIYPQKGAIAVGADADLVLWNPDETRRVRGDETFSRAGFSVYEGWTVTGWPKMTIRRGQVVYRDGQITARPGSGRSLSCDLDRRLLGCFNAP
jgi:dihydropyrimidinase